MRVPLQLCLLEREVVDAMVLAGVLAQDAIVGERDGQIAVRCDPALAAWCRLHAKRIPPDRAIAFLRAAVIIEAAVPPN